MEQNSESYRAEAEYIYERLETLYAVTEDYVTEDLIGQLEGQWRYARQRAEELWDSGN